MNRPSAGPKAFRKTAFSRTLRIDLAATNWHTPQVYIMGEAETMRTVAVIPARLASTRLPRKALREIAGKLLIGRVYEAVRSSPLLNNGDVIIATDSNEIMEACRRHGWKAQMTSAAHRSGTERVHEISQSVPADVYLNVQGDEPMTRANTSPD